MTGVLVEQHKSMFEHFFHSVKFHAQETSFGIINGMLWIFTIRDVPTLLTALGVLIGSIIMPWYYGRRKYKKQEEREQETAIIKAIKDLRELGFINPNDPIDIQREKAVEWLTKPTKNV